MTTLDTVIESLGGMGRFQILVITFTCGPRTLYGWSMLHMAYVGVTPDWWCVTSGSNLTLAKHDSSMFQQCEMNGSECASEVFDSSMSTVISEWGLVCDRAIIRPNIISIQMAGVLVGAFVMGQISDLFGRRYTYFATLALHAVLNVISAFSVTWEMFAALRFFIGMCIGSFFVLEIPYAIEFQPTRWRSVVASLPTWNVGLALLALAAWLTEDWSKLHLINGLLHIPFLLGFFVTPESVRWLAVSGRLDEAEDIVDRMARINRKNKPSNCRQILELVAEEERESKAESQKHSYLDLYRGWKIARTSILIQFIWVAMSVSNYGISFGVVGLSGNIYINLLLVNTIGTPITFSTFWLANRFGRRPTIAVFFFLSAAAALANIAVILAAPEDMRQTTVLVLCLIAKVALECAWAVVVTHNNEIYPTSFRNIGYGAANTVTRLGGMVSPYAIDFEALPVVSYIVIGCSMLLSGFAVLPLDDTTDKDLPDTVVSSAFAQEKEERGGPTPADKGVSTIHNGFEPVKAADSKYNGDVILYSTHF